MNSSTHAVSRGAIAEWNSFSMSPPEAALTLLGTGPLIIAEFPNSKLRPHGHHGFCLRVHLEK